MTKCSMCSSSVREDMKFCPRCGSKLNIPTKSEDSKPGPNEAAQNEDFESAESLTAPQPAPEDPRTKRNTILAWSAGGAILLASIGIAIGLEAQNQAEEDAAAATAEAIADACANVLQTHESAVDDGVVLTRREYLGEIEVQIEDSEGRVIGSSATCEYSTNAEENTFAIDSIEWQRELDGVTSNITYSRSTNLITVAPERPEIVEQEASSSASNSCADAFRAAAAVPLSQDNNAEIRETTFACSDVDEWWRTLQRYPDVFGMTNYLESEKDLYVGSACLVGQGSPVCQDAARLGLTF